MTKVSYCKSWFRAKKVATEPISNAEARLLHSKGEAYCALLGKPTAPTHFLEITPKSVGVGFLDGRLRERLSYSFQELEPGRLFLSMAVWRDFESTTDKVVAGTSYIFERSGSLRIRRESFIPAHILEVSDTTTDVAANWDLVPDFGDYSSLVAVERRHEH